MYEYSWSQDCTHLTSRCKRHSTSNADHFDDSGHFSCCALCTTWRISSARSPAVALHRDRNYLVYYTIPATEYAHHRHDPSLVARLQRYKFQLAAILTLSGSALVADGEPEPARRKSCSRTAILWCKGSQNASFVMQRGEKQCAPSIAPNSFSWTDPQALRASSWYRQSVYCCCSGNLKC